MPKRYLLASSDAALVRTVSRALADMEAAADVCAGVMEAFEALPKKAYDGLIVDCDDMELTSQMLRGLRATPEIAHAIVVALVPNGDAVKAAFASGANFALHKPVTMIQVQRSLRAARGMVFRTTAAEIK